MLMYIPLFDEKVSRHCAVIQFIYGAESEKKPFLHVIGNGLKLEVTPSSNL